ncbi:sigma 54-interacting transcriptional regulator [Pannus brasiliensis CCIBt3594]|uniref:Sigma 54-interacting transcriptional regulator n=1 Tax=Pannus brasiliensis CCIBt3594 TaxID=1427578 RepID=A0AAW9QX94_9CHRO
MNSHPRSIDPPPLAIDGENGQKNRENWLASHPVWGQLPPDTLREIDRASQIFNVRAGTVIYREGDIPEGIYLLKRGEIEISGESSPDTSLMRYGNAGDLFGYALLVGDRAGESYPSGAISLIDSEIALIARSEFDRLCREYPEIQQAINSLLARDLGDHERRVTWERSRIQGLQSYLRSIPLGETVLGSSKNARKLSEQIDRAATGLQPVILQARPGTGKTFVAGKIHERSGLNKHPFVELDCSELPRLGDGKRNTDILFGRAGEKAGILQLLERGTLLLDNVQELSDGDRSRLLHYLQTGSLVPNHEIAGTPSLEPYSSGVRLILASPDKLEFPGVEAIAIKLDRLSARKADIPDFADYFLDRFCRESGRSPLQLDRSDLRRLMSYDYPGNLAELAEILHRAVIMTSPEQSIVPEQVLWSVESPKNAFRLDLLTHVSWLRPLLLSRWYPESIWIAMMVVFVPVVLWGFLGPQSRESSLTLNLFWAWWWPGYLFMFAFVGRLWCAVCPFMVAGEWSRRVSLWLWPRQQLPWNTRWLNRWGAWILFAGFVAIYLWERLWDLPHRAYLSAWLLLIITAGAVIFSLIYERRLWCRHLCPIGGMNGMFAKLSIIELRSTPQVCGAQCTTFGCYKGSAATPIAFANAFPTEGQAGDGCPLYSHPAHLRDNRDCMFCMTCLKSCPNRSAQLNLRFPASDLLDNHQEFPAEAALLLLLLGGVFLHYSGEIVNSFGWRNLAIDSEHLAVSVPIALFLLSIPAILTYLAHSIARFLDPEQPDYLTVIYAYLPLTLAVNLTHYIPAAITEAGRILPVFARTLGYSGAGLPSLTWSPDVAAFLQGVTLLSALVFSPYPLLRITKRSIASNLPHFLLLFALTAIGFRLMVFPS